MTAAQQHLSTLTPENTSYREQIFADCLTEVFARLEKLEGKNENPSNFRPMDPKPKGEVSANGSFAISQIKNHPEGHPIPEYNDKQCEVLFKAVFKNSDKIKTAESYLIDCVYDFLDHRLNYPKDTYGKDAELREWGEQDYNNYEAMVEAAKALSEL